MTEVNVSATVEMSATVGEMSATVGEIEYDLGNLTVEMDFRSVAISWDIMILLHEDYCCMF